MATNSDTTSNAHTSSNNSEFAWVPIPLPRNPKLTHAAFLAHWAGPHGSKAVWILKHIGADGYIQIHLPNLSEYSEDALGAADATQAGELRKVDGISLVHFPVTTLQKMPEVLAHPYNQLVMIPDDRLFVHEEFGLQPVVARDPPYFRAPAWSAEEWREWAKKVGGKERRVIVDGEVVVPVAEEYRKKWEEVNGGV